jgi:hypothetical protein
MKSFYFSLLAWMVFFIIQTPIVPAQLCDYWSEPLPITDSLTNNRNAFFVIIEGDEPGYYVFWEKSTETMGTAIVYMEIYELGMPDTVVDAAAYPVSNPQVMAMKGQFGGTDTIALVFYQTFQNGNEDIYYVAMTDSGFTEPAPFVSTPADESCLRISQGGGMVWQEGDAIMFSRLRKDESGFYFEPKAAIDYEDCRRPDIDKSLDGNEQYIAWEKGSPDSAEIWYSYWRWDTGAWSEPLLLFEEGNNRNLKFCNTLEWFGPVPMLFWDNLDTLGEYRIYGYFLPYMTEFVTEFSQTVPFDPYYFAFPIMVEDYWDFGYLAFSDEEPNDNQDIFTSDWGGLTPDYSSYCRLDSSLQPDVNPQLYEGQWYGWYFDLICIWESYRNDHWQLFSSRAPVYIGNIHETTGKDNLHLAASPNPFDGYTRLQFIIKDPSVITFRIFDMYGRGLWDNGEMYYDAGNHEVMLSLPGLPPGAYLLQVIANQYSGNIIIVKRQ